MNRKLIAALATVAVLGAACSSSTSHNVGSASSVSPTTAAATTKTSTGVTDTEIKVSALGYKAFYGEGLIGAQARFKRENDAGGVNGRKIILTDFNDDNQTPAADSQVAAKIVQQDKPFAIVPVLTAAFPAADFLDKQGVPFLGWGIVPDWCKKNAGFSITGCTDPAIQTRVNDLVGTAEKALPDKSATGKTIALIGVDNESAKITLQSFADQWTVHDAKVVYNKATIPLPPTVVSDYTPFAQAIMTSNGGKAPDLLMGVSSVTDGAGIAKKVRELGYKGAIVEFSLYDPRIAALSKDVYNVVTFAPWEDTTSPAVAQMTKDVNALDAKATKGLALAAGYWSADLFIDILKKAGKDLTRESFIAAGNADFKYAGKGGTADLSFPADHTEADSGSALVFGTGQGYQVVVPFGTTPGIPKDDFKKQLAQKQAK